MTICLVVALTLQDSQQSLALCQETVIARESPLKMSVIQFVIELACWKTYLFGESPAFS